MTLAEPLTALSVAVPPQTRSASLLPVKSLVTMEISMKTPKLSACCGLFVLIVGCADTGGRWENPELPEGSWARDEADCRLEASERAAGQLETFEQGWSDGPDRAQSVVESWKWQQTRRQERELLEACMIKKGYLWASTDANADESAKDVEDQ